MRDGACATSPLRFDPDELGFLDRSFLDRFFATRARRLASALASIAAILAAFASWAAVSKAAPSRIMVVISSAVSVPLLARDSD